MEQHTPAVIIAGTMPQEEPEPEVLETWIGEAYRRSGEQYEGVHAETSSFVLLSGVVDGLFGNQAEQTKNGTVQHQVDLYYFRLYNSSNAADLALGSTPLDESYYTDYCVILGESGEAPEAGSLVYATSQVVTVDGQRFDVHAYALRDSHGFETTY